MKTATISNPGLLERQPCSSRLDRFARRLVLRRLEDIRYGRITVREGEHVFSFGEPESASNLAVDITVSDGGFYGDLAFGGSVGAGEAYMQGFWSCSDLTALVRLMLKNRDVLDGVDTGAARLAVPLRKLAHRVNRNTRSGSRRNIAAHYDLGNDFFGLWLDPTMMYSSAVFEREDMTLEEASVAKLDRICRKLQLGPSDHVVEIGTGWGGFAVHAASRYGCRVTTTTISAEQYAYARERVREAGLQDKITLLKQDYRDLKGRFDKLVSIEMIEAIGHQYLDTYFEKCASLLRPEGMMLLQAITIADQRYDQALRTVDFIKRHIFPGSFIPSVSAMTDSIARTTDMRLYHMEDIGPHYATTLRLWRERFFDSLDRVRAMGFPEDFVRMWEFYLCYCEGGFVERAIGDVQMLLTKPACRRAPIVPALGQS
jgi:cyclopropane-fatty-acyl-phospholipid synthase